MKEYVGHARAKDNPVTKRSNRTWNSLGGVLGNLAVAGIIVSVTVLNIIEGAWVYVGLAVIVLVGFGVVPAIVAHREGELYFTRPRRGRGPRHG